MSRPLLPLDTRYGRLLGFVTLDVTFYLSIAGIALVYLVAAEATKRWFFNKAAEPARATIGTIMSLPSTDHKLPGPSVGPTVTDTRPRQWKKHLRVVIGLAAMAFAVHIILPQVKELPDAIQQVQKGSFWWLLAALGVSLIGYLAGAISLQGSLEQSIPLWPATETTLATAFTGLLAPRESER